MITLKTQIAYSNIRGRIDIPRRNMPQIVLGFFVPFVGTVLGAGLVFFLKSNMNEKLDQFLIGLAAGMMMSASIWSLILPAMQMTNQSSSLFWLPCTIGFCCGVLFLIVVEIV